MEGAPFVVLDREDMRHTTVVLHADIPSGRNSLAEAIGIELSDVEEVRRLGMLPQPDDDGFYYARERYPKDLCGTVECPMQVECVLPFCTKRATYGGLCKAHLADSGLEIRESSIHGMGLFTTREFSPGELLSPMLGWETTERELREMAEKAKHPHGNAYVDGHGYHRVAHSSKCGLLRFGNTANVGEEYKNNARFEHRTEHPAYMFGRVTHVIPRGREVLVKYNCDVHPARRVTFAATDTRVSRQRKTAVAPRPPRPAVRRDASAQGQPRRRRRTRLEELLGISLTNRRRRKSKSRMVMMEDDEDSS